MVNGDKNRYSKSLHIEVQEAHLHAKFVEETPPWMFLTKLLIVNIKCNLILWDNIKFQQSFFDKLQIWNSKIVTLQMIHAFQDFH